MEYVIEMLVQGARRLQHDPYLGELIARTLQLALISTAIAALIGFPIACAIGLGASRVSRSSLILANAGLGLPPVGIGVYVYMLVDGSWQDMKGMVLGQTLLSLPVVIALGAVAIRRLPDGLVDQAHAFGASGWRLGAFAMREAKIGVIAAVVIAIGSAIAEVGAVTIIGGNDTGSTATLASQIKSNPGHAYDLIAGVTHRVDGFVGLSVP